LKAALRTIQAVQVLENLGSREARELLANGTPEARLTQEAKAALKRPARRHIVRP
jgi:hypothetical protein